MRLARQLPWPHRPRGINQEELEQQTRLALATFRLVGRHHHLAVCRLPLRLIYGRLSLQHFLIRLIPDHDLEPGKWVELVNTDHGGDRADRIVNVDGVRKALMLVHKYGFGPRHVHCNERMEQACCDAAMGHEATEERFLRHTLRRSGEGYDRR